MKHKPDWIWNGSSGSKVFRSSKNDVLIEGDLLVSGSGKPSKNDDEPSCSGLTDLRGERPKKTVDGPSCAYLSKEDVPSKTKCKIYKFINIPIHLKWKKK